MLAAEHATPVPSVETRTLKVDNGETIMGMLQDAGVSNQDAAKIVDAMKLTWKRLKIVMEPSSAVPLAAILRHRDTFAGRRVGVIVTGGNVDLDKATENILATLTVAGIDVPVHTAPDGGPADPGEVTRTAFEEAARLGRNVVIVDGRSPARLIKALKVRGVHDAAGKELQRLSVWALRWSSLRPRRWC